MPEAPAVRRGKSQVPGSGKGVLTVNYGTSGWVAIRMESCKTHGRVGVYLDDFYGDYRENEYVYLSFSHLVFSRLVCTV